MAVTLERISLLSISSSSSWMVGKRMRSDDDIFRAPELAPRELMERFSWEAETGGEMRSSVSSGSGEDIPSRSVSEVRSGQIQ